MTGPWDKRNARRGPRDQTTVSSAKDEMDFEALFESASAGPSRRYEPGEAVTGEIVHVGARVAEIALEGGVEGMLELASLDEEDRARIEEGKTFRGYAVRTRDRLVEVSLRLGRGGADPLALQDAMDSGLPVEGKVVEANKGGLVVEVGGLRGFCPLSQVDLRRVEDAEVFVGRKLQFLVQELRGGKDPLLSRRALLEIEREDRAANLRERLEPGLKVTGEVVRVMDFGAFVDLGGIDGLIPVSELGHGRPNPEEVVSVGQQVEVEVLRVDMDEKGRDRVTLSMRALEADPLEAACRELTTGMVLRGRVTRLTTFGAFVELAPGIEGLIHVSAFGRRVRSPRDVVRADERIAVAVLSTDPDAKRIGLRYVPEADLGDVIDKSAKAPPIAVAVELLGVSPGVAAELASQRQAEINAAEASRAAVPGKIFEVTVERIEHFGVFVTWPGGGRGLVPLAELGLRSASAVRRRVPVGTVFEAMVTESVAGRVRLSKAEAEKAREQQEAKAYLDKQKGQMNRRDEPDLGSFGALLKAKLEGKG